MPGRKFKYGLIEGFFGKPWSWEDRKACTTFLAENNYGFYIYAPKNDGYLRKEWRDDWPEKTYTELRDFSRDAKKKNIQVGIGLSPFEIYLDFNADAKKALRRKLRIINNLEPDILCLLFDDMRGDIPNLADIQAKVFDFVSNISNAPSFIVCPSYYSFDPILERFFGKMPDNYLEDLGLFLDPAVDIFWTGPQVCSPGYSQTHLAHVTDLLRRKPFLWDNYPVNDSPRMAPFLHLRAFKDRPHQMSEWTSGHAVNPMNQSYLSRIPMKTLTMSYESKSQYTPDAAFPKATRSLCGPKLGDCIIEDIALFQDKGLNELSQIDKDALITKYQAFPSPYAIEIVSWLKGEYADA